ncbi:hypothetical protein SS7213T_03025, partial [Staphylococcus simiae CCM 7213 = CCUG 51256]
FGKFSTSIGLAMYDRLAGVKKSERKIATPIVACNEQGFV